METRKQAPNPNPNAPEIRHAQGLEFRESQTPDGQTVRTIFGYVVKYDQDSVVMRDWAGDEFVERIATGAFDQALRENTIKALWSHDRSRVLGNTAKGTLRLRSDDVGLHFEVDLPNNTVGDDAWESIRRGDVDGMSFGFNARKDKWAKEDRGEGKRPLYRRSVLDADLREVSPVAFPAYPDSEVSVRSLNDFRDEETRAAREVKKRLIALELELLS